MIPRGRLIPVLFGGQAVAWTPATALPVSGVSPVLWMYADDLAGSDGDAVVTWTSKEGSAFAFAGAATKQPLLKKAANGINGHNTVLFDGSNDILVYTAANAVSTATQGTVFVVYRMTAVDKSANALVSSMDEGTAAATGFFIEGLFQTTGKFVRSWHRVASGTVDDVRCDTVLSATTPYLATFRSSGTAYSAWVNGTAQTLTVATGTNSGDWWGDAPNRDSFTLGGIKYNAEANQLKGDIAEIAMYDIGLETADIDTVESYLATRYGITLA
jgi:hypothetical protein